MFDGRNGLSSTTLDRINDSIESATGLPNNAYTNPEFFELEREYLFSTTWTCIGQACTIPNPGDARPVSFVGMPFLMVRDKQGLVRVFHNVCSHRGNQLVRETCRLIEVIRCPYHSWTYGLDGQLRGTPHIGGPGKHDIEGFDRKSNGLKPVRSAVWMDLVFVNVSETAPSFDQHIAKLEERLFDLASAEDFARLRPAVSHGVLELELGANWKLCLENNLESYHLPWVHPDLNSYSKLEDHYHFYGGDLFAGQGTKAYDLAKGNGVSPPLFPGWPGTLAEYPTLFPNVFLGAQCDHMWSIVIEPIAHNRTRERLQIYYLDHGADNDSYEGSRKAQLEAWTKVFNEDIGVVEGMQRGRQSPGFSGGVFSPAMDKPTHHFNKWVANTLSGTFDSEG